MFDAYKNLRIFFLYCFSNISVDCNFSNPFVVWCESYKKEKLFEMEKKDATRILMQACKV
jgi:hypothetical protein